MEYLKLNETPMRTSRNFNINNIKLKDVKIPRKVENFKNLEIINESNKDIIEAIKSDVNLTYGLSESLLEEIKESCNSSYRININSKTERKIQLNFNLDDKNLNLIDNIEIIANEDIKQTVILKYGTDGNINGYHNGVLNVKAKRGARLNVIILNLMNSNTNHFMAIQNILENDAKVNYTIVDFGGRNSITNYYSNLIGTKSSNNLNTIYIGNENQVFDLNYISELRGQETKINIEVQGALMDNAKKHFKGTIDFKKGCKKAIGNENENCILLSDTAKSLSLPMLLCSEENVEGNHSSSAGKIDPKELFYIMSRGFSLKESQKLMVRAKFNKILENIKDEELKTQIVQEIDKKIK